MPFDVTCGNHEHTEKYMHACKWSKNVALGVVYQWHCRFLIYLLIWESKHFKRQFNFQRSKKSQNSRDIFSRCVLIILHFVSPCRWSKSMKPSPCFSLILCLLLLQERSAVFFWKKKIVLLLSGKFDYQHKLLSS